MVISFMAQLPPFVHIDVFIMVFYHGRAPRASLAAAVFALRGAEFHKKTRPAGTISGQTDS